MNNQSSDLMKTISTQKMEPKQRAVQRAYRVGSGEFGRATEARRGVLQQQPRKPAGYEKRRVLSQKGIVHVPFGVIGDCLGIQANNRSREEEQFMLGRKQAQSTLARSNADSPLSTHAIPVVGHNLVLNMPVSTISAERSAERADEEGIDGCSPASSGLNSLAKRISAQMNSRKRANTQEGERRRSSKAKLVAGRVRKKSQLLDVLIPPVVHEPDQRYSFEPTAPKAFHYEKESKMNDIKIIGTKAIHSRAKSASGLTGIARNTDILQQLESFERFNNLIPEPSQDE